MGPSFLGRIVGLAFLIPFLWFLMRKAIPVGWTKRLLIPGVLIGLQGVIGWWMVTSGLTERVDVAPYRLATHLGLAFIIFALLVWNALSLGHSEVDLLAARRRRFKPLLGFSAIAMTLLFLQILAGAMVAGLDAGRGYTDWPLMQGSFFPPHSTPEAIWQFIHRMLGYGVVAVVAVFWWKARGSGHQQVRFWTGIAALAALAQMLWGIVTLINGALPGYAIFHQLGALALMFLMLRAMFEIAYRRNRRSNEHEATRSPVEEVGAYLAEVYPEAARQAEIEHVGPMKARMRLHRDPRHLRPGGTISGPSITLLADVTFYVAVMAMIGREAMTVTTSMNLNFMRKPADLDLLCDARILKLGRRLAVGDAVLYSEGGSPDEPVAHATLTYAIP